MDILRTLNASFFLSTTSQLSSKIGISVLHVPEMNVQSEPISQLPDPACVDVLPALLQKQ